jgi:hypothetical protein
MEEEMTAMSWVISAAFLVLVGSSPVQSATDASVDPAQAQIIGCTTPSAKLRGCRKTGASSSPKRHPLRKRCEFLIANTGNAAQESYDSA